MSNITETQSSSPPWVNRLIVTLLSASLLAASGAGLSVWKQSALIQQRITTVDNKYIDRSQRVIKRLDTLAISLAQHFSDDNAHALLIQKQHSGFEHFMKQLEDAHKDIEYNKHTLQLMQQGCCKERK